ncbi:hypothetical protein BJ684DRAFT_22457 [Piptocephalis cylindrospora]|uniref:AMP-dependent synthetase/ligase domain-containing protein n=1 Tax=Piptocephalis cylindrospora TaxID=1907219 RepID=A0A4P9Y720_9FUNG|nr:hypothetical protein BJ684DRAFT_22457 [Piptocephalis cylindrospora]|eukprot:RKP14793.1 hypothetical protein BJ684DRAFT_22457 [Piptocephalis cylindrospora]
MTTQTPIEPKLLWSPPDADTTQMSQFRRAVNERFGLSLSTYGELHAWSCEKRSDFWGFLYNYFQVKGSTQPKAPVVDESLPPAALPRWFEGTRMNMAENLLFRAALPSEKHLAMISTAEGQEKPTLMTYGELREQVRVMRSALRRHSGVGVGDRVAGFLPNCPEAVIIMLAAVSLGAIWTCTSPDFGVTGVLERLKQVNPKVLFVVDGVIYNGKVPANHGEKVSAIIEGLEGSVRDVVLLPFLKGKTVATPAAIPPAPHHPSLIPWDKYVGMGSTEDALVFEQVSFDHPVYILFSSGTTGAPKCIVHGGGGLLLQTLKEHIIHGGLQPKDIFLQYTTTGWMMWNWMVAALGVGSTLFKVTAFGTSAKYLQSLEEAGVHPRESFSLESLHSIYSTGSALRPESFDFVYKHIRSSVLLGSITGGTDICSLFAGHNSALPVYRGEIQCRSLGMKIEAWKPEASNDPEVRQGHPVVGESGDLVCSAAFPCQPLGFWGDGLAQGTDPFIKLGMGPKYKASYFSEYTSGIWYHGDFVWVNPNTGGVIMLGRSDGTLNPGGVRFGSAELYNVVGAFPEVADSLAVGQKMGEDERVVMFLIPAQGYSITPELIKSINLKIRQQLSPRHVPAITLSTPEIPHTVNGKKVEVAVKRIISGEAYVPSGTLVNPDCLEYYKNIPELAIPSSSTGTEMSSKGKL